MKIRIMRMCMCAQHGSLIAKTLAIMGKKKVVWIMFMPKSSPVFKCVMGFVRTKIKFVANVYFHLCLITTPTIIAIIIEVAQLKQNIHCSTLSGARVGVPLKLAQPANTYQENGGIVNVEIVKVLLKPLKYLCHVLNISQNYVKYFPVFIFKTI